MPREARVADLTPEFDLECSMAVSADRKREILQRRFKELPATDLERLRTVARRTLLIGTKVTCLSQACATI